MSIKLPPNIEKLREKSAQEHWKASKNIEQSLQSAVLCAYLIGFDEAYTTSQASVKELVEAAKKITKAMQNGDCPATCEYIDLFDAVSKFDGGADE